MNEEKERRQDDSIILELVKSVAKIESLLEAKLEDISEMKEDIKELKKGQLAQCDNCEVKLDLEKEKENIASINERVNKLENVPGKIAIKGWLVIGSLVLAGISTYIGILIGKL